MKRIQFEEDALKQFHEWERTDEKIFRRIIELLDDARQNPFKGIGKPEPLKHQFKGWWSRRINRQHRLIYKVSGDALIVIGCKYHY